MEEARDKNQDLEQAECPRFPKFTTFQRKTDQHVHSLDETLLPLVSDDKSASESKSSYHLSANQTVIPLNYSKLTSESECMVKDCLLPNTGYVQQDEKSMDQSATRLQNTLANEITGYRQFENVPVPQLSNQGCCLNGPVSTSRKACSSINAEQNCPSTRQQFPAQLRADPQVRNSTSQLPRVEKPEYILANKIAINSTNQMHPKQVTNEYDPKQVTNKKLAFTSNNDSETVAWYSFNRIILYLLAFLFIGLMLFTIIVSSLSNVSVTVDPMLHYVLGPPPYLTGLLLLMLIL